MLHRQALKKILELKLPMVKVVRDSKTEDSHRANKKTVIILHTVMGKLIM